MVATVRFYARGVRSVHKTEHLNAAFGSITPRYPETPKGILYAAADAEKISEYILTIEQKREVGQTREATTVKEQIPHGERIYLAVRILFRIWYLCWNLTRDDSFGRQNVSSKV
jgi:hypothetical protein